MSCVLPILCSSGIPYYWGMNVVWVYALSNNDPHDPAAHRETKEVGASPSVAQECDEFDQMDAEEREEATSGTSHTVSWGKARVYLCAVLTARCTLRVFIGMALCHCRRGYHSRRQTSMLTVTVSFRQMLRIRV